jgi:hypothetical protein
LTDPPEECDGVADPSGDVGGAVVESTVHQVAAGVVGDGDQAPEVLAFGGHFILDAGLAQQLVDLPPAQDTCCHPQPPYEWKRRIRGWLTRSWNASIRP